MLEIMVAIENGVNKNPIKLDEVFKSSQVK